MLPVPIKFEIISMNSAIHLKEIKELFLITSQEDVLSSTTVIFSTKNFLNVLLNQGREILYNCIQWKI